MDGELGCMQEDVDVHIDVVELALKGPQLHIKGGGGMLLGAAGVEMVGGSKGGGHESARVARWWGETAKAFALKRALARLAAISVTAQR
jgi:hypothetical protein